MTPALLIMLTANLSMLMERPLSLGLISNHALTRVALQDAGARKAQNANNELRDVVAPPFEAGGSRKSAMPGCNSDRQQVAVIARRVCDDCVRAVAA